MAKTTISTLHQLRNLIRSTRQKQQLTQAELAQRAGVSRKWLGDFERGNPNAQLALVFAVMDALGLNLSVEFGEPNQAQKKDAIDDFIARSTRVGEG